MNNSVEKVEVIMGMSGVDTIDEAVYLASCATDIVGKVADAIGNVSATFVQMKQLAASVEMEYARLDHALDCLMVKAQRDIRIYEQTLPILDKQFSACQARMDRLIDKAMEIMCEDVSQNSLNKQEAMMNLIELTNSSLNGLVAKLMPQY
ncbi:MAG: hypothetical protein HDR88_17755 [Bacteroides sp.]|nr:hypothetical protein [Bacteroides sp.]